jgi:peptidoglycan/LPS O-acetylase OafA/YrhL
MKISEIERLRAFAVLIVILGHFSPDLKVNMLEKHIGEGWGGVDLFFVISGFVITRSLLKMLPDFNPQSSFVERVTQASTGLKYFFCKRIFRIVPMALAWMFIPLLISLLYNKSQNLNPHAILNEIYMIVSLQYNFGMVFGTPADLGYYWSLMVEEHFYLLLPFFFIVFTSKNSRVIAALVAISIIVVFIHPFLALTYNPEARIGATHWLSYQKFDALFSGVFLSLALKENWFGFVKDLPKYVTWSVSLFALCYIWTAPTLSC